MEKKILYLTLKKQWYDLINQGIKKEEYREIKPYWVKRLENNHFDEVFFRHGYAKDAPTMSFIIDNISIAEGKEEWGAVKGVKYYTISLGKRLS